MQKFLPYLAALLNAAIVGLSFLFTKMALETASPVDTLGWRFFIGWAVLSIYLKMFMKKLPNKNIRFEKKTITSLLVLALLYPTIFFSFQAFGLAYTSSAEGGIIMAFSPALTALLASIFLKEKMNIFQTIFIFLSIFGVVYIFYSNGSGITVSDDKILGILFLLVSTVAISGYAVLSRYLSDSFTPIQLTYLMVTMGMLFFNLCAIIKNALTGELAGYFYLITELKFIGSVLFLGIFATMITAFLSNYILSKLSASRMSIFSNLSTVISIAAGAILLNEQINLYHIIGSIMIIAGVLGTNLLKETSIQRTDKVFKSRLRVDEKI
ncbi:DMT family transporter [Bacillus sp. FJAT-29814]|uniref:DMT family transporter n=1 Tax=Bacillus sp. FJAT-29814 TaxID=1729688 RepID=UPI00082F255F|nr:DMT family transporter [Bacillus sp. FJAT-29814]